MYVLVWMGYSSNGTGVYKVNQTTGHRVFEIGQCQSQNELKSQMYKMLPEIEKILFLVIFCLLCKILGGEKEFNRIYVLWLVVNDTVTFMIDFV